MQQTKKSSTYILVAFFIALFLSTNGIAEDNSGSSSSCYKYSVKEKSEVPSHIVQLAYKGLEKLTKNGNTIKSLAIIDFSKPSTEKRLYIIDPSTGKLLYQTFVAHGKNSGENLPTRFSNKMNSLQSSLGFYLTGSVYNGAHGKSLQLIGCEKGINDHAFERGIVLHGADYVNEKFIRTNNRLGRSHGCPAVSYDDLSDVITLLKDNGCLFVYAPDNTYIRRSSLLK